ncbi:hypothetical protein HC891_10165 [Candidatus Gracilibacteria bacterium]|nr:hypothetical protein [Candidatus Gracilibacteria bacterium]
MIADADLGMAVVSLFEGREGQHNFDTGAITGMACDLPVAGQHSDTLLDAGQAHMLCKRGCIQELFVVKATAPIFDHQGDGLSVTQQGQLNRSRAGMATDVAQQLLCDAKEPRLYDRRQTFIAEVMAIGDLPAIDL